MKMPTDLSNTLSRGADEARGVLQQTASLIEAEWKRIIDTVDGSDSVPAPVKTAVGRVDGAVGDVKDFVVTTGPKVVADGVRRAREAGVPIPEDWNLGDAKDEAEAAAEDLADDAEAAADDIVDAELVETDEVAEKATATATKAKKATKSTAKKATKKATKTASKATSKAKKA